MRMTRDLFKKIRDTQGTFHAKMGSIKDRNGMDLTEAEDINKWQEYTDQIRSDQSLSPVRIFATPWTVCSLPGSSVHEIFQARVLEWGAIAFSGRDL